MLQFLLLTTVTWWFPFICADLLLVDMFCVFSINESYNNGYTVVICIKRSIDIVHPHKYNKKIVTSVV